MAHHVDAVLDQMTDDVVLRAITLMKTPTPSLLYLIEYRLKSVEIGRLALGYAMQWDEVPSITIRFGGKLVIEGKATAFTNSAIEAAIIHCRTLLEFLGLGESSQTKLREFDIRNRIDDDAIELYDGLSKVSIKKAVEGYHGTADEAEAALAYLV